MRGWEQMRAEMVGLLERSTGEGLEAWTARTREATDEASLRAWLDEQGVHGYAQSLLVMERFGYPPFLLASAEELVDAQYADRPALRPLLDAVVAEGSALGEVAVQARKTYVCLVGPRRTFAQLLPATRTRLDLGLRLPDVAPQGRLEPRTSALSNSTHRIRLTVPADLDDEVRGWLRAAYEASCSPR